METSLKVANPWKGAAVFVRERVSSTMDEARELARRGCAEGTVVVAGFQEKGRGRAPGRAWISAPWESLLATLVLDSRRLGFPRAQLPLRAALAVCLAVENAGAVHLQVKWPNDVQHRGKKLAGILCEMCDGAMLVGMGVNCAQRSFPPDLAGSVCSIFQASGREISPLALLPGVLSRVKSVLEDGSWRAALRDRLASRGSRVRVSGMPGRPPVDGIVRDVDEEGRLVLEDAGGALVTASAGELQDLSGA